MRISAPDSVLPGRKRPYGHGSYFRRCRQAAGRSFGGGNVDNGRRTLRFWHPLPVFAQALDVVADRLSDLAYGVFSGVSGGDADPAYSGVLAHNPAPLFKGSYRATWGREEPYTLDHLAAVIPFNWEPPSVRQTGVGRNVDLFEAGCRWAGRPMNKNLRVLPALMTVNQDFAHPLPLSEV